MYEKDGEKYFIVDGHVHFWDARNENLANRYGQGFIECFYGYHASLSPPEKVVKFSEFQHFDEDRLISDLFVKGPDDVAIFQPTYLMDFYKTGFNTTERNGALARKYPGKFIVNGAFDPRDGEPGLERLEALNEEWDLKGVKLYTAEWKGESKGWSLTDPMAHRYLAKCEELGITNIHIHKGPTIWPLNRDAFDVADVDHAASNFSNLNFIVEHVGLPRLEDFCWIAAQEPNVYSGIAVALPFIHSRPRYFAQIIGELLYWTNDDRILFGSDYGIWEPGWLVERFVDFQIPEDMQGEYGTISIDSKRKILGLNAARLYNIPIPADVPQPAAEPVGTGAANGGPFIGVPG